MNNEPITLTDLSDRLGSVVGEVAQMESDFFDARSEVKRLTSELAEANRKLGEQDLQLLEAQADREVYELIADHKRGVISTDELYERTVGGS